MSLERFCQPECFCSSIYIETALNARDECIEFANLLFWRLSLCLSRDTLSRDTRSLDLCILFKFIFLYLWYILPHSSTFDAFYFTPIFSYVYYHARNIFLIPDDTVAQIFIIFFNFSSHRRQFELYFLSNGCSFDTMEFSIKHKC